MKSQAYIYTCAFLALLSASACGVKAPPTPVLDSPPSLLQQEAQKRMKEQQDKAKAKDANREREKQ
ncbi:hypothetical protein EBU99_00040 [bacterium]|nr:hypothetical protein [bacterium]